VFIKKLHNPLQKQFASLIRKRMPLSRVTEQLGWRICRNQRIPGLSYDGPTTVIGNTSIRPDGQSVQRLLSDGVNTYTYDAANRLVSVTSNQYSGLGDRLTETVNGVTTTFTMDLNTGLIPSSTSSPTPSAPCANWPTQPAQSPWRHPMAT
jgi:YD repeat-containing protein